MLYPIAIELGDETYAYGVTIPDIVGCFSAGDTMEEALKNVREAIELHLEGLVEDGLEIFHCQPIWPNINNTLIFSEVMFGRL